MERNKLEELLSSDLENVKGGKSEGNCICQSGAGSVIIQEPGTIK